MMIMMIYVYDDEYEKRKKKIQMTKKTKKICLKLIKILIDDIGGGELTKEQN